MLDFFTLGWGCSGFVVTLPSQSSILWDNPSGGDWGCTESEPPCYIPACVIVITYVEASLLPLQKAHACHGFPICLHFVTVKSQHYLGIRYWFLIEKHGRLLTNHLPVFWRNLKLNRIPMDHGWGYRSPCCIGRLMVFYGDRTCMFM